MPLWRTMPARSRSLWLAGLVLFGLFYIEPMWLLRHLGADDVSYVAHATTLGLDMDLDYSNEPVLSWNRAKTIAAHPIGAGIMAAPFVAAGGLLDRAADHPVVTDHGSYRYSWSLFGFYVAAIVYFGLGIWLYWRSLRLVWPGLDPRLNLLLALSTGVPFYVLRRFTMSHAFEFATCALGFWAAIGLYRALGRDEPIRKWLLWGGVAAIANVAVRMNNLNLLILGHTVLLLLYVHDSESLPRPPWRRLRAGLLGLTGATAVLSLPLLVFNVIFYGAPYPTPMRMYSQPLTGMEQRSFVEILLEGLSRLPNLVPLVFSSEWGLLYSNPVLVLGGGFVVVIGVRRLIRRADLPSTLALLATLAFFGLSTAVVIWWRTTGSSYGYRYLLPVYPVALLGVAMALHGHQSLGPRARRAFVAALIALSGVSLASQMFFSASDRLEVRAQVNVFGVYHGASAAGFLTSLPGELLRSDTWVSLPARRLIGFYAGPYIVRHESLRERLPEDYIDSYDRLYRPAPARVYVQLTLVLLLWTVAGWLVLRPLWAAVRVGRPAAAPAPRLAPEPRSATHVVG